MISGKAATPTTRELVQPKGTENRYRYLDESGQHLHELDGRPLIGTSTVCKILAKPLTWWASGCAVEVFGCPDPKLLTRIKNKKASQEEIEKHRRALELALFNLKHTSVDDYCAMIDKAYRAHDTYMRSRAKEGVDLHGELERFVKDHIGFDLAVFGAIPTYEPKIHPFIEWAEKNVKRFLWSEGHCYSEKHWLGGICDVGYEKKDGTFGIGDFKSAKDAYFDHFAQIGGYDIQISENDVMDRNGELLYALEKPISEYIVVPFGAAKIEPKPYVDPAGMRETFLHMLAIYNRMPRE